MPVIPLSKSSALRSSWHKELINRRLEEALDNGSLTHFPVDLDQMLQKYLERKKLRINTDPYDRHIDDLINEHVEMGGCREIAVLACTLAFSSLLAKVNLRLLSYKSDGTPSFSRYLHCLIVANSMAPTYVSDRDALVASLLLQIRMGCRNPHAVFRNIVKALSGTQNSGVLSSSYINELLNSCGIPLVLDGMFSQLYTQCKFFSLHECVSWVAGYVNPQQHQVAYEVLIVQIPQLQLWASWQPDTEMLKKWEAFNFTPAQKSMLRPLFHLEGPDITRSGQPTFKNAGMACIQTIAISPPDLATLRRLFHLLVDALEVGPQAVDLFIHTCIEAPATVESLSYVEKIVGIRDSQCCSAALSLMGALEPDATIGARMTSLSSSLQILEENPTLCEMFADRVIDIVVPTMNTAQQTYRTQMSTSSSAAMGQKIQQYALAIQQATWLQEFLDADFLATIDRFPPNNYFQDIMSRLQSPQPESVETSLKAYLVATVGGSGTADEIALLKIAVDQEQELWINHHDAERNRILSIIRNMPYVQDAGFLRACRAQILLEDIVLLRDLLGLVERDSHVACIDMLRILARRIELPMAVHEIWIMLSLLMMQQRKEEIIIWASENLSVTSWFRFVSDMHVVFGGRPEERSTLASIGMTAPRLAWWHTLQNKYMRGVEYIDLLQRQQSGGIASMRWLFLKEIPNLEPLLRTILNLKPLGYNHQWILSFFEPSPNTIATLCNCLAAHEKASPHGLSGAHMILKRFHTVAKWPDSAAQAYAMAWMRSQNLTDGDRTTLTLLSELMGIRPTVNIHGMGVIKTTILEEYDGLIALARRTESYRICLGRKDNARTSKLVETLGLQATQTYSDPDIPENLSDAIECVGNRQYELSFPLTHLQGHHRKTRGIGSSLFPIIAVRVNLEGTGKTHGFCVHMVPYDTVHEAGRGLLEPLPNPLAGNHQYWVPGESRYRKPTNKVCTTTFNLFTHALTQRLHRHFMTGNASLRSIYDVVSDTIKRPGAECTSCGDPLRGLWKPTVCTKDACVKEMSRSSLLVRAYGLLVDPPVLDFLLGCVYAAAKDTSGLQLLTPDCPFTPARLAEIIDTFPAMPVDESMTPFDLLKKIKESRHMAGEREQVLAWMSKWFRGCMLSAPQGKRLAIMANVEQFLLFNSTPECEKAFDDTMRQQPDGSVRSGMPTRIGSVTFHGSQVSRMWKVLTEGLRNMSNTRYMANGAVNGAGIYLADEPATSYGYSGAFSSATTWAGSAFVGKKVLLGCELVEKNPNAPPPTGNRRPPAGTHIVTDESRVLVRYVFICPSTYTMPPARHINTAMRSTFSSLRAGPSV